MVVTNFILHHVLLLYTFSNVSVLNKDVKHVYILFLRQRPKKNRQIAQYLGYLYLDTMYHRDARCRLNGTIPAWFFNF